MYKMKKNLLELDINYASSFFFFLVFILNMIIYFDGKNVV
jgi:hypothetical protein